MRSQTCLKVRAPVELSAADRRPLRPFGFASGMEAWTQANKNPKVLLICPPALDPKIEKGPTASSPLRSSRQNGRRRIPECGIGCFNRWSRWFTTYVRSAEKARSGGCREGEGDFEVDIPCPADRPVYGRCFRRLIASSSAGIVSNKLDFVGW